MPDGSWKRVAENVGFPAGLERTIVVDLSGKLPAGVRRIRLLTNNQTKVVGLQGYGLEIVERVPIQILPNEHNTRYLKTKKDKLGHLLDHME